MGEKFMVPSIGKYIIWVERLGLMFSKTMIKTAKWVGRMLVSPRDGCL
jgi:hypothetical protein